MEEPEYYQFDIDTAKVTELWRRGSVVSSWLLDLTAAALQENPTLEGLAGRVSDSGEGRWTVKAAVDIGVPAPVLAASLFERFASRGEDKFANQVLSAMRQQFGGHKELPAGSELEAGGEKADKVEATPAPSGRHQLTALTVLERRSCRRSRRTNRTTQSRGREASAGVRRPPAAGRLPVLPRVDVALGAGVSVFVGANGQGKTNLVEAIEYLSTLSSHRVAADLPLVRSGAERAIIRARVQAGLDDPRQLQLEVEITPGQANRARLNRSPLRRARELVGVLRTVVFSPEDLAIVKGDPSERRRFLDELIVARWPRLAGVRADYDRVLRAAQHPAQVAQRAVPRRSAGAEAGRHPGRLGRPPGRGRRRAAGRSAAHPDRPGART